jgi:hypothetical protein
VATLLWSIEINWYKNATTDIHWFWMNDTYCGQYGGVLLTREELGVFYSIAVDNGLLYIGHDSYVSVFRLVYILSNKQAINILLNAITACKNNARRSKAISIRKKIIALNVTTTKQPQTTKCYGLEVFVTKTVSN